MQRILPTLTFLAVVGHAAPVRTLPASNLPYTFELNQGQTSPAVRYLARGKGYTLFLTGSEAVMTMKRSGGEPQVLRMSLAGGRAPSQVDALDHEGSSNYFVGDPSQWRRIYDANRSTIGENPDSVRIGTTLRIPPKQ